MDTKRCFICFDNNNIIQTCKCGLRVHSECLIEYIEMSKKNKCDICKYEYKCITENDVSFKKILLIIKNTIDAFCAITLAIIYLYLLDTIDFNNVVANQLKLIYTFTVQYIFYFMLFFHILYASRKHIIKSVINHVLFQQYRVMILTLLSTTDAELENSLMTFVEKIGKKSWFSGYIISILFSIYFSILACKKTTINLMKLKKIIKLEIFAKRISEIQQYIPIPNDNASTANQNHIVNNWRVLSSDTHIIVNANGVAQIVYI